MDKEMSVISVFISTAIFIIGMIMGVSFARMEQLEPVIIISENRVEVIKEIEVPVVKERIVETEVIHEVERVPETILTNEEKILMARLIHAEAGWEDFIGKRLVADVILNRVDAVSGNTVTKVIYSPGQFTSPASTYTEEDLAAVEAECYERLDYEIMYFRAHYFFSKHPKAYQHGNHYFSY